MAEDRNPLRLFRSRSYRLLWVGSTTSSLGAAITGVALAWVVFSSTGNTLAVTLLGLANFVPGIVIGLVAGVFADRYDRRRLMLRSDVVRAVATVGLVGLLVLHGFALVGVLAVVVVISAFSAIFRPASNAIIPMLVEGDDLGDANGILFAGSTLGGFVGSAVGGLCIVTVGAVLGFTINAATYALSAAMLFLLVVPRVLGAGSAGAAPEPSSVPAPPKPRSYAADLREGFAYMLSQPALLWTSVLSLFANFFLAFYLQYSVVYVSVGLHSGAAVYGAESALGAIGWGVGALLVGRFRLTRWTGWVYIVAWGTSGVLLASLGVWPSVPLLLFVALGFSIGGGVANTTYFACVQRIVPGRLLGRFFAIDEVTSFAVIPLGQIVGGITILALGIDQAFLIAGVGTTASIVALLFSRESRQLSDVDPARYGGEPHPSAAVPGPSAA